MSESDTLESRDEIADAVSTVYHDLNNPISIISGNAQFLMEISREKELDDQFISSIQDIQEAAQQLSNSLDRLTTLKERIKETDE